VHIAEVSTDRACLSEWLTKALVLEQVEKALRRTRSGDLGSELQRDMLPVEVLGEDTRLVRAGIPSRGFSDSQS